jgi:hypothetical protein
MKWFRKTETLETRLFKSIAVGNREEVRTLLGEHPDLNLTFYCWDCGNKVGLLRLSEIEKFHKGVRDKWSRSDGRYATYHQRTPTELTDLFLRANKNAVYRDILEDLVALGYPPPYMYLCEDLVNAVKSNDVKAVETLVRKKADVDHEGSAGEYPIITAVEDGNLPIVKLLVENGAHMETKSYMFDKKFYIETGTPLVDDVLGYEETFKFGGYTPLMLAVEFGNAEIAKYLIDKGADVNAKDRRGETVLMKAERRQIPEIMSLLKTKGAEPVYRKAEDLAGDKFCAKELLKMWFPPASSNDRIEEALRRGDRLHAMSWYSARRGVSYKEAKEAIDRILLYAANEGVSYKEAIQAIDKMMPRKKPLK